MEDKILNRIQELTEKLETLVVKREGLISDIRVTELQIKEISAAVVELKKLLD